MFLDTAIHKACVNPARNQCNMELPEVTKGLPHITEKRDLIYENRVPVHKEEEGPGRGNACTSFPNMAKIFRVGRPHVCKHFFFEEMLIRKLC